MASATYNPKSKYYLAVFYTESVADNFREVLNARKVQYAISPCHNKDLDKDGNIKKPHYHIICYFPKYATLSTATNLFKSIGFTIPILPKDVKQSYNYLSHTGFDDKYQYNVDDIEKSDSFILEVDVDITDILNYCIVNQVQTVAQLTMLVLGDSDIDDKKKWIQIISSKAYYFKEFFNTVMY